MFGIDDLTLGACFTAISSLAFSAGYFTTKIRDVIGQIDDVEQKINSARSEDNQRESKKKFNRALIQIKEMNFGDAKFNLKEAIFLWERASSNIRKAKKDDDKGQKENDESIYPTMCYMMACLCLTLNKLNSAYEYCKKSLAADYANSLLTYRLKVIIETFYMNRLNPDTSLAQLKAKYGNTTEEIQIELVDNYLKMKRRQEDFGVDANKLYIWFKRLEELIKVVIKNGLQGKEIVRNEGEQIHGYERLLNRIKVITDGRECSTNCVTVITAQP